MPIRWVGNRASVKPSTAVFGFAACVAVAMQLGFIQAVVAAGSVAAQKPSTLVLGWVTWNLLPAILFAIGILLRRAGK